MPAPRPLRSRAALAAALLATAALTGCRARPARPAPAAAAVDVSHVHALLLNGGGTATQNYQSHLLHLQQLDGLLRRMGVPRERVAIFSSDGSDPAPDVAMREMQPERDFWLVEGSRLEGPLRTPVTLGNSAVDGAVLMPATKADLRRWFEQDGRRLRAGDTLLLYVTDHGTRNKTDPNNNGITLWGDTLSVQELADLLSGLDPGVRVVTVMSQCYSGGFARLASLRPPGRLPDGSTCGYFSSTADRPAYGCYPENRGRDNVGHSFHMLETLAETGRLNEAHANALEHDVTPDVPLRTSDAWLEAVLGEAARAAGREFTPFVDGLLAEAWRNRDAWEPELRQLDRIGHAFGSFSPRSLRELDDQAARIGGATGQLKMYHGAWEATLGSARRANLERFVTARPAWAPRLSNEALQAMPPADTRKLAAELLGELAPATRADRPTARRLASLREKSETAEAVAYRMDVRIGVLLRMRALLIDVAGREYLATRGTAGERAAYDALRSCEELVLPAIGTLPEVQLARPEPFPPLEDDLERTAKVLPGWMGIQFQPAASEVREQNQLAGGAAAVVSVYPDSPALAAGLKPGDVVLGPPGRPFTERDQIREWTMLRAVDEPASLDVLRKNEHVRLTLVPKPMPRQWSHLSTPPKAGTQAPPLKLGKYRGEAPTTLADGKPHLLFFWATWCAICKSSLPELLAFEKESGTSVIAITDEMPDRLDPFFAKYEGPFPAVVATDELRLSFLAYAVSGMPTFVLVDGTGTVRSYGVGYSAAQGLPIDGWAWSKRPAPAPPAG